MWPKWSATETNQSLTVPKEAQGTDWLLGSPVTGGIKEGLLNLGRLFGGASPWLEELARRPGLPTWGHGIPRAQGPPRGEPLKHRQPPHPTPRAPAEQAQVDKSSREDSEQLSPTLTQEDESGAGLLAEATAAWTWRGWRKAEGRWAERGLWVRWNPNRL